MAAPIDTTIPPAANDSVLFINAMTATAVIRLAATIEKLERRLDVVFAEAGPGIVPKLRQLVEESVAFLDDFAGDLEAEDDGTGEPMLGWTDMEARSGRHVLVDGEAEDDDADEEDDPGEVNGDDEPSLAAGEGVVDQRMWLVGGDDDREPDNAA